MKTKNVRLRQKDLHNGKIIYIAHPKHGIETVRVVGKPHMVYHRSILGTDKPRPLGLFIDCVYLELFLGKPLPCHRSLDDMGIMDGKGYNFKRSFSSMKSAKAYIEQTKHCAHYQAYQKRHESMLQEYTSF